MHNLQQHPQSCLSWRLKQGIKVTFPWFSGCRASFKYEEKFHVKLFCTSSTAPRREFYGSFLITGGIGINTSEVLNLTSNKICSDIVATNPLESSIGGAFINGRPLTCHSHECYFYDVIQNKWVDRIKFNNGRDPSTSSQLVNGPWIVSGGSLNKFLTSVEYYDGNKFQLIPDILPRPMAGHCQVGYHVIIYIEWYDHLRSHWMTTDFSSRMAFTLTSSTGMKRTSPSCPIQPMRSTIFLIVAWSTIGAFV